MSHDVTLFEQVPVAGYSFRLVDDEFLLERVNGAARLRNPDLVSLCGKPMAGLYRDQPLVIDDARRCATERVTVERELPVRRYDRTEATQFLRLTFVPAPPNHILLFLQDVANADVTRTALEESEARYQSLIAALPDAVLLRGADGRILFCNEVGVSLFGAKDQASLLGEIDLLAPGMQLQTETGVYVAESEFPSRKVLATGKPEVGRVYALAGHGKLRWVRIAAQPIRSANGTLTGSVTTFTDITDRVTAQGALRESAARLDLALSAAKMGVWEYEPGADVGWWSPNLDHHFQLGGRGRGLRGFLEHIHPNERDSLRKQAQAAMCGRVGESFEQEFRIIGEDEVVRWARIRGSYSLDGTRRYVGGTIVDITEQRQLEEELRRASRLESLGRLAGGVAHDFNNLLAAMLGSLELMEDQCPESVRHDLSTIRHSVLRARDLTRQLLTFARKQPVEWKTVDLADLVRNVELMLHRLVGPNVHIVITNADVVFVRADPSLLEQVLVNLVINARDAMPNGGRLEIRVGREAAPNPESGEDSGSAVLEVADSGIGMDEETRRKIFDPFFTTKSHGTGLGLASSYGIVQQHRGRISVDSHPGRGTCFRVTLPALAVPLALPEGSAVRPEIHVSAGNVLVVDDEDVVRQTAARLAASLGYSVAVASNGAEADAHAAGENVRIDILICDIAMPGEDGPAIASRLRRRHPKLKVLFMSGYSSDMEDGPLDRAAFLQKPFSRQELAEKLASLPAD